MTHIRVFFYNILYSFVEGQIITVGSTRKFELNNIGKIISVYVLRRRNMKRIFN